MRLSLTAAIFSILATTVSAGSISFTNGWQEQRLSLFSSNKYSFGKSLGLISDDSVSIAWTRVGKNDWGTSRASWNWRVDQSVPATNLAKKRG